MNRNLYCCQRCGSLKYDWAGNLCPECLEKDRLRKEGKKYFGMPIKMREATKEEKQGVNEYIQSISEKVYTKEEVISIFKGIQLEIKELTKCPYNKCDDEDDCPFQDCMIHGDHVNDIIQKRINALKGGNGYAE